MAKAETKTIEAVANGPGHNSDASVDAAIIEYFQESVEIDLVRRSATKRKGRARQKLKDMGLDTKAIDGKYSYYKQKNHERDGYDEASRYVDRAIKGGKNGDLFAALYDVENAS